MLPHLSPLNGDLAGVPVQVPPPPRFKPIVGRIEEVDYAPHSHFMGKGRTASQKAGLVYEDRIRSRLRENHSTVYLDQPTLHFRDGGGWRTCIPDGLDVFDDKVIIVEIKSQHMPEAWWQLRRLYEPVVRKLFLNTPVAVLEICRVYDPSMPFPEKVTLVDNYEKFTREAGDGELGVYRWRM